MFLLELKYASILITRFKYHKKIGRDSWRFACPICGDSKKSRKTRGNLFPHNGHLFFKCFNCGVSKSFRNFLKEIDSCMFDQFLLESLKGQSKRKDSPDKLVKDAIKSSSDNISKHFDKVSVLSGLEPLKLCPNTIQNCVSKRKICIDTFGKYLFYTDAFLHFIKKFQPDKFKGEIKRDYPRIAIVAFDEYDRPIFIQFRQLISSDPMPKYMTLKFQQDHEKIFGIDRINKKQLTYITEGPFDSMFLDNAIAVAGSDLLTAIEKYGKITNPCFVFDNEPRSPIIVKKIENVLSIGHKVVLYDTYNTFKDLNDMVLGGINVKEMVKRRTFSGIRAKLEFNKWKKV